MEMQNLQEIKVEELEYWPKNPSPFMLYGLKYKKRNKKNPEMGVRIINKN